MEGTQSQRRKGKGVRGDKIGKLGIRKRIKLSTAAHRMTKESGSGYELVQISTDNQNPYLLFKSYLRDKQNHSKPQLIPGQQRISSTPALLKNSESPKSP
jgi:hypothetical protein